MPRIPGTEMTVLVAAQQAVVRWRRSAPTGSFDRILTEVEHDWWPGAADGGNERRAFRQVAAVLQARSGDVLADPEPLLALVRQTLAETAEP